MNSAADIAPSWVVLRTKPRQELVAKSNCERQGVQTLLPKFIDEWTGRERILFPSYLFVVMVNGQWTFLKNTWGVLGLIMLGQESPATVPPRVMNELLKRTEQSGLVTLDVLDHFVKGQEVTVTKGAFQGHRATFEKLDGHARCCILLSVFGRQIPVTVPRGSLEAV